MAGAKIVVAFDLYGTLLSTESIGKELAKHCEQEKASQVAALWRRYQLEYTWRLNAMGQYQSFSAITLNSLQHASKELGVTLKNEDMNELMKAYDSLSTFSDVEEALKALAKGQDITPVIFSNGTLQMVTTSVKESPDLGPLASVFQQLVVVEAVKTFKPAPTVYEYLAEQVGKTKSEMGDIWLVTANPFDVVGAVSCGLKAAWVDRPGKGWQDNMCPDVRPTIMVQDIRQVVDAVLGHSR